MGWELDTVEKPFVEQLVSMGWRYVEGDLDTPAATSRTSFTEVIQEANHDNGIKAWVICPGFVDTDMGEVVPGANPLNFLRVSDVVDVARYLIRLDYNVKLGPDILIRTMRNPMTA